MHDVAIVGAGPVGLLTAVLLACGGADVVVFERRVTPGARSRAIGLHPPASAALAKAGLGPALDAEAGLLRRGLALSYRREPQSRGRDPRSMGGVLGRIPFDPPVLILPQRRLETLLTERLLDLIPGALRTGVEVRSTEHHDQSVVLSTNEVDGGHGVGLTTARLVVAADGVRSGLRREARIPWRAVGHPESYLMADLDDASLPSSEAWLWFGPEGVVESFPLPGGRRRWVALTREPARDATPDELSERLAGLVRARTGLGGRRGCASLFLAEQHLAGEFVHNRLVLVGDAAHEISPIGGQGMNLGLLDATSLAPALLAIRGQNGQWEAPEAPLSAVLAGYLRTRRRAARRAVAQASFNMVIGRPSTGLSLGGRRLLIRALATAPLRRPLADAFTMRWLA